MALLLTDEAAFEAILTTFRLSVRAINKVTVEEGIDTLEGLCSLSSKELTDTINGLNKSYRTAAAAHRCNIGTAVAKRLHALRRWAKDSLIEGGDPIEANAAVLATFDDDWRDEMCEEYNESIATNVDNSSDVMRINYDGTNWYDAKRSILDVTGSKIGAKGVPLSYLLRSQRGNWFDQYETMEERRIATYKHSGHGYQDDNKALYQVLAQYFSATACNDAVRRYEKSKNGRAAWGAVIAQLEGVDYKRELIQQAKVKISAAKFTGNARFGFDDYYKIHVRCHLMFYEGGQPMRENQKITDFMLGVTQAGIVSDYKNNRSNPALCNNFQLMYNHLAEGHRLDFPEGAPSKYSKKRNISALNSDSNEGRGRGRGGGCGRSRGRGRGRGRGGRDNRGGRGGDSGGTSALPDAIRNQPHNSIPADTWNNLTRNQRQAVFTLRENTSDSRNNGRNVSSVGQNDDMSAITDTNTQATGNTTAGNRNGTSSNAGDSMGSRQTRN